jgi:hypothetical protein
MVAQCMECQGGSGLEHKKCLTGILNGLSHEFNVDSVILSHYIETKYADDSMQVLRIMVEIIQNLEQMGIREPYEEYFANEESLSSSLKNQQKGKCEKCNLEPETVFSDLKKQFVKDISSFYYKFNDFTGSVAANREEACNQCVKATKSDLVFLFNRLENFRAFAIYKGFQIVV